MNPYTHLRTLLDDESKHWRINAELACSANGAKYIEYDIYYRDNDGKIFCIEDAKYQYTTSLDALLPLWPEGWEWNIYTIRPDSYKCLVNPYGQTIDTTNHKEAERPTPALAMLDCLLQVLEYEWEGKR